MKVVYRLNGQEMPRDQFASVANGDRLREMLESGTPPAVNTDNTFMAGVCNGSQFEHQTEVGDYYASVAREQGQSITGKKYLSGLAEYPGDPRAWVSGKDDVIRVCEERGWGCEGDVTVEARPVKEREETKVRLAPDIADGIVDSWIESNPELAARPRDELTAEAVAKHGART